jgi:3-isopropylmalate/(R)-2-methylmalate dehydratase small subunit
MQTFGGPVQFLDRSDINTDEIIPAKHLNEVSKEALKPYVLEDLRIPGFDRTGEQFRKARVIVTRENFGCGSSREHAPWALEVNGITTVIAQSFARIFRQNMFNCGMLAIEASKKDVDSLFGLPDRACMICDVDLHDKSLIFSWGKGKSSAFRFSLNEFDEALVKAGGWLEFADARY